MNRELEISLMRNTWSGPIPPEIAGLGGKWQVDIREVLLHLAIWTRPPTVTGLDLSDCWAWLRYARALDPGPPLRLCQEWSNIDAHQKVILSDDFGIGFPTCLLIQKLDYCLFAETRFVVDILLKGRGPFVLLKGKKRGPAKAPDFIGLATDGSLNILECKGSQDSPDALDKAMARGIVQKNNFKAAGSSPIRHSLVGGVFVPQNSSGSDSLLRLCDPKRVELSQLLKASSPVALRTTLIRIALAKHLALMNLNTWATVIASSALVAGTSLRNVAPNAEEELKLLELSQDDAYAFAHRLRTPFRNERDSRVRSSSTRFVADANRNLLDDLLQTPDLLRRIARLWEQVVETRWKTQVHNDTLTLFSPLGFRFSLSTQGADGLGKGYRNTFRPTEV